MHILFYDLETCFIKSGFKRNITRMLEIGVHAENIQYQKMINPLQSYDSGEEIIKNLQKMDQDPHKTVNFWTKLLVEKGALKTNLKRADTMRKADEIAILLKRSDKAKQHKNPQDWLFALESFDDDIKKAKEFIKTKKAEKPKSLLFYDTKDCLTELLQYSDYIWVAHNGKSFDEKIVKGNAERLAINMPIKFEDSLPVFRKLLKDQPSYSLPILHKSVLKKSYKAHHAYEDAKALADLFHHVIGDKKINDIFEESKKSDLLTLKGVGKKTVEALSKKNIKTLKDLYAYIDTHTIDDWYKEFSHVHNFKALGSRVFNTASV